MSPFAELVRCEKTDMRNQIKLAAIALAVLVGTGAGAGYRFMKAFYAAQ
jgi:hypothetical protein